MHHFRVEPEATVGLGVTRRQYPNAPCTTQVEDLKFDAHQLRQRCAPYEGLIVGLASKLDRLPPQLSATAATGAFSSSGPLDKEFGDGGLLDDVLSKPTAKASAGATVADTERFDEFAEVDDLLARHRAGLAMDAAAHLAVPCC